MHKIIFFALIIVISFQLKAQYKNDNVLYKTVYPEDLNAALKANPNHLLLDVRSKGENEDTSMMGMNIGRLKNAKNIDVRELGKRLNEIQNYKNTPVFVYCSHSQRSRRASKMLADSGFTKVFNINGGMTTLLQTNSNIGDIYETKNKFQYLSTAQFCNAVNNKNAFLLDVRSDSLYNSVTADEQDNAIGKFKNAVHISLAKLNNSMSEIPKDKMIIIIDAYGNESTQAATSLTSNGYKNVSVLFDGMYNLISTFDGACKKNIWQQNRKYYSLTFDEFDALAKHTDAVILDVRPSLEYNNQSKDSRRNIGRIKNAVNIPVSDLQNKINEIASYKNKPVIVYNSSSNRDAYNAAATLTANGFTNVNILTGGIFNLRWRAANFKGKSYLKDWVTDIPADNL